MTRKQIFTALQKYALAKPGAKEEYPWGDAIWKVNGKIFAGSCDETGETTVKATLEEQAKLIRKPNIRVADYVGRFGWVTISVTNAKLLALAKDLIDKSYESVTAGKKKARAKR